MGLVVLSNVIAPNSLWQAGTTGKQRRKNSRAQAGGGAKQININWSHTERYYSFGTVPQTTQVWETLEGLHERTAGGAYGFLVEDPKDNTVDDTGRATLITGTTYQLVQRKPVTGSSETSDRKVTRPKAGFVLKISGVVQTLTVDYTVNLETGVVTIPAAPSASTVSWVGNFYVAVHFEEDEIDWELAISGYKSMRRVRAQTVTLCEVKE